ncbi:Type VI secretion system tip protein VgrG [Sulfidibacter corallicola]|uniref:Type VI secretion system tip protein VgrG n=1 Tax=Sulfidibacter corallicola TaxID=2818388 RepID=A0A8A4TFM9_SULCO|nr:type VI secretion system tip protein TssI/VgrG [Sulfidibacter corallicola]QTD48360.1 type VI secretion system tip protein VgrG [Sulfidibacter corallicola]
MLEERHLEGISQPGPAAPHHRHNADDIFWSGPGADIQVVKFELDERFMEPSTLVVTFKSPNGLDPAKFINRDAGIVLKAGPRQTQDRPLNGIVAQFRHLRTAFLLIPETQGHDREYYYQVVIRPRIFLLSKAHRSKVFQKKSVMDIVSEVMGGMGVSHTWKTRGSFAEREYTLQYNESDLNFIHRLLEAEGAYYFYDHFERQIVFADHIGAHPACKPDEVAVYDEERQLKEKDREALFAVQYGLNLGTGAVACHDYNYTTSGTQLMAGSSVQGAGAPGGTELYCHNSLYEDGGRGAQMAAVLSQGLASQMVDLAGESNCRSFGCGYRFKLKGHYLPEVNKSWLLSDIHIQAEQGHFHCKWKAVSTDIPYRQVPQTPVPKVYGLQTAKVTGPGGAEVYLDQMGRCKLQFHWDREGPWSDHSSMWVRVSNNYAGRDFGIQFIPRVGQEVLVEFLQGNPDHPIVVGRAYNDMNPAPLGPAEKYQNIIKTIKDHHIMFDDTDGKELFDVRSEKDMNILVVNDQTRNIGHDQSTSVGHCQSISVGCNQTMSVGNNRQVSIGNDQTSNINRNQTHGVGNDQSTSVANNRSVSVGNNHMEAVAANQTVVVNNIQSIAVANNQATVVGNDQITRVAKDTHRVTGNNAVNLVGNNQMSTIAANETSVVGANVAESVGANKSTIIGSNNSKSVGDNLVEQVGGARSQTIGKASVETVLGAKSTTVGGVYGIQVGGAMNTAVGLMYAEETGLMRKIKAGMQISISCGASKITLNRAGKVSIKGTEVSIEASANLNLKAGGSVKITGGPDVTVSGGVIKLN